jgi:tetratricopeptide (TPR) repeat protein
MRFLQLVLALFFLFGLPACRQLSAALLTQGNHDYQKGDYNRAVQDYDRAIRLNPKSAGAFNGRGADRPLLRAVVTGVIWAIWHYPLMLRGYNFPDNRLLGLLVFPVSTISLSIIFGWLRLKTGSIWSSSLAHAATNGIGGLTLLLFGGGASMLFVSYVGIMGWIPLGALSAWIVSTGQLNPANDMFKEPCSGEESGLSAAQ